MREIYKLPSQAQLRRLFFYDCRTGEMTWLYRCAAKPEWNSRYAGKRAGYVSHGYWAIRIGSIKYKAARLIWKYVTGLDPVGEIDHKNIIANDDRWENLRDSTRTQNGRNRRVWPRKKTGLPKGVKIGCRKYPPNYSASITINYKKIHLGMYDTIEAAANAYDEACIKHHGEFARRNKDDWNSELLGTLR